ncbi:MAG: amidohydrolase family protein [Candidatus Heimdallarchaeota archaeon]|nr:amidohydrolase family protein [Candidatus Heimdallarchaeota archaeon]
MEIIDAHANILSSPDYVLELMTEMNRLEISKACISGLGSMFNSVSNKEILKIVDDFSPRFVGAYFVRPGVTNVMEIQDAHSLGFRMLKVAIPKKPYNDQAFLPLWGAAQRLNMPILFHTGLITVAEASPKDMILSLDMHPLRIEPIANSFPDLNIILSQLGGHWNRDAAELARMRANVYVDLTGEQDGWRQRIDVEGLEKYLYWPNAFQDLVFGTNTEPSQIEQILSEDRNRYTKLNLDENTKEMIFSGNIKKMLGIH